MAGIHKIEAGVRLILEGVGEDPEREGLKDTPSRVARMLRELCTADPFDPTVFTNEEGYDQLIVVRNIPFYSLCEHHLVPFFGTVSVGYLPNDSYFGLSKLARCVQMCARKLQVQERFTMQIADWIEQKTQPLGVGVVCRARHLCMEMRGAKSVGSETITSALRGVFFTELAARQEFLSQLEE